MGKSYPNQKTIIIHKNYPKADFLQISNDHWMEVNKKYGPYALQLYLYLAKNANNYNFALSPEAAEIEAGIKRTSYYKFLNLLIAEGYLVKRKGNTYDFYETPCEQEKEEMRRPPCEKLTSLPNEQESSSHECRSSLEEQKCTYNNREINKRYNKY